MSRTPHLIADAIPLLDVSAYLAGERATLETLAGELRWAFENVGFYYLRGHGIDRSLIDATYAAAARFHAHPMEKKLALRTDEHNIGYLAMAGGQWAGHYENPETKRRFRNLVEVAGLFDDLIALKPRMATYQPESEQSLLHLRRPKELVIGLGRADLRSPQARQDALHA